VKGSGLRHEFHPSPNHDERAPGIAPSILLLHYTGMADAATSLRRLCDPMAKVSSHYVVDEGGRIIQLVDEVARAWHAGQATWRGMTDINSASIGIEIQNPGHDGGYPDFAEAQMVSLIALCRDVVGRHKIRGERVLAHSDVAPARKADPGEKFDWRRLHEAGVGHWVVEAKAAGGKALRLGDKSPAVAELQRALALYGYGLATSGVYDVPTDLVVTAFQRHFRQSCVNGVADPSTVETLFHLIAALPFNSDGTI
jgi:N-acetylmuramoyl-L-alanine amidase